MFFSLQYSGVSSNLEKKIVQNLKAVLISLLKVGENIPEKPYQMSGLEGCFRGILNVPWISSVAVN